MHRLFEGDLELAFEPTGQRAGLLGDRDRVTTRLGILFSPRERAATASAIFHVAGRDLFPIRARDRQVGFDVDHWA